MKRSSQGGLVGFFAACLVCATSLADPVAQVGANRPTATSFIDRPRQHAASQTRYVLHFPSCTQIICVAVPDMGSIIRSLPSEHVSRMLPFFRESGLASASPNRRIRARQRDPP